MLVRIQATEPSNVAGDAEWGSSDEGLWFLTIKCTLPIWPSNPTPGVYPVKIISSFHIKTCFPHKSLYKLYLKVETTQMLLSKRLDKWLGHNQPLSSAQQWRAHHWHTWLESFLRPPLTFMNDTDNFIGYFHL